MRGGLNLSWLRHGWGIDLFSHTICSIANLICLVRVDLIWPTSPGF